MRAGAFVSFLVLAATASGQQPCRADVQWAWANVKCKDGVCSSCDAVVWAWASAPSIHPDDLPEKEGCQCGPNCSCCVNGQCDCANGECKKISQADLYAKLRDRAIREKKPLAVGVGCEPPRVEGVLACRYDKWPDAGVKEGIVVGFVQGGNLLHYPALPKSATPDQIKAAAKPRPATVPASSCPDGKCPLQK